MSVLAPLGVRERAALALEVVAIRAGIDENCVVLAKEMARGSGVAQPVLPDQFVDNAARTEVLVEEAAHVG